MKKLLSALFVLIALNSFAQSDSTKSTRKALIDSVCACAAKQDTSQVKTKNDLQKVVMQCFMQRMDMFVKIMQEENVDITDAKAQQDFGQQLGMEMVLQCPVLMQLSVKVAAQELEEAPAPKAEEKKTPAVKPKATVKPSTAKPKTTATTKTKG